MDQQDRNKVELPFNNLFLNSGLVNGSNQWWMYVFGTGLAFMGYVLFQFVFIGALVVVATNRGYSPADLQKDPSVLLNPDLLGVDRNLMLALLLGMFAFALLGLYLAVRYVHHKVFTSIITAYSKIRWKRFFTGFLVWGLLVVVVTVGGYFLDPEGITVSFDPKRFFSLVFVCVLLMPIQTSTEEILIRGYLLQGLSLVFRNGIVPLIITSLIFGLMHMGNPEAANYGWSVMLPYYCYFGLFLGIVTLLDEGLELAMGIHFANNFISSLLVTSPKGALQTDAIFSVQDMNPGGELIMAVVMSLVTFGVFWLIYRWKNFNLILK